jgi:hypothetical protein
MRSPTTPDVSVPTDKPKLTVYVETDVHESLGKEATKERRSMSQMAALLIEEALRARGYDFSAGGDEEAIVKPQPKGKKVVRG